GAAGVEMSDRQSVGRKAVEQASAAGALEIRLAAAAFGSARGVRRVPRPTFDGVLDALPVDMAEHRRALGAACPVLAGAVFAGREGAAFHGGARKCIVFVGSVAAALHRVALF